MNPGDLNASIAGRSFRVVVWLVVKAAPHAVEARAQDPWDTAEQRIRRLPADSFPGLPEGVREAMHRLRCAVPQGSDLEHPHSVVAGRFATVDQVDWAFLCSVGGISSIYVLWGGEERCETPVSPAEDRAFLQGLGEGSIGFSRRLMTVDRDRMLSYANAFGGPPVPEVWHQGLEDYFEGKASVVLLCVDGEWITLAGID